MCEKGVEAGTRGGYPKVNVLADERAKVSGRATQICELPQMIDFLEQPEIVQHALLINIKNSVIAAISRCQSFGELIDALIGSLNQGFHSPTVSSAGFMGSGSFRVEFLQYPAKVQLPEHVFHQLQGAANRRDRKDYSGAWNYNKGFADTTPPDLGGYWKGLQDSNSSQGDYKGVYLQIRLIYPLGGYAYSEKINELILEPVLSALIEQFNYIKENILKSIHLETGLPNEGVLRDYIPERLIGKDITIGRIQVSYLDEIGWLMASDDKDAQGRIKEHILKHVSKGLQGAGRNSQLPVFITDDGELVIISQGDGIEVIQEMLQKLQEYCNNNPYEVNSKRVIIRLGGSIIRTNGHFKNRGRLFEESRGLLVLGGVRKTLIDRDGILGNKYISTFTDTHEVNEKDLQAMFKVGSSRRRHQLNFSDYTPHLNTL